MERLFLGYWLKSPHPALIYKSFVVREGRLLGKISFEVKEKDDWGERKDQKERGGDAKVDGVSRASNLHKASESRSPNTQFTLSQAVRSNKNIRNERLKMHYAEDTKGTKHTRTKR